MLSITTMQTSLLLKRPKLTWNC